MPVRPLRLCTRIRLLVLTIALAALAAPARAQTMTATLNAAFPEYVRRSLSTASLTFPDTDPDLLAQVPAMPAEIDITAKARAVSGGTVTLTVQASDDLRSGTTTLPAALITWTTTERGGWSFLKPSICRRRSFSERSSFVI